jgi:hypothetical protein
MLQSSGDRTFFFGNSEREAGARDPEALQALAKDRFEKLPRTIAVKGIRIEDGDRWQPDGAGLQNRSALLQNVDHGLQLRLSYSKGSTLHGGNALAGSREAEVRRSRNDHARCAVDLAEQIIVHQNAAVFGREEVRASACRKPDLKTSASHLRRHLADGRVLADFAFFKFGHPHLTESFGFQQPDVFITKNVPFGEQFLAPGPKNRTAKNSSCGFPNINSLRSHVAWDSLTPLASMKKDAEIFSICDARATSRRALERLVIHFTYFSQNSKNKMPLSTNIVVVVGMP